MITRWRKLYQRRINVASTAAALNCDLLLRVVNKHVDRAASIGNTSVCLYSCNYRTFIFLLLWFLLLLLSLLLLLLLFYGGCLIVNSKRLASRRLSGLTAENWFDPRNQSASIPDENEIVAIWWNGQSFWANFSLLSWRF